MASPRIFIFCFVFYLTPLFLFSQNHGIVLKNTEAPILKFEENKNQFDPKVLYEVDLIKSGKLFLEKNTFTYLFWNQDEIEQMHHPSNNADPAQWKNGVAVHFHCVKAEFLNANPDVNVYSQNPVSYYKNYFIGNDPQKWASDVKLYEEVNYSELYTGVDMHVYSKENNLKYDFIVSPDGNPDDIQINYNGPEKVFLKDGNLNILTNQGIITEEKPYAYQLIDGIETEVKCRFELKENVLSFSFPNGYVKTQPLIIDPTLVCSTFSGSTSDNWGYTATYDAAGDIYAGGIAAAFGYPTTVGAFQTTFGGGGSGGNNYPFDITLTKYNPAGTALIFSTYLGGSDNEQPQSIVVDNNNELCVIGRTYSANFPTTAGAYDVSYNGGADIIVTKFNPAGTALIGSTFVGGAGEDGVNITANFFAWSSLKYNYGDDGRSDIITDNAGNCYIASETQSINFPTTGGAFQTAFGGGTQDGCVFKLNSALTAMTFCTYLGGNSDDACYSIVLNGANEVYVSGGTSSTDFPTTVGTLHTTYQGGAADGFITHLNAAGSSVLQSSYIGTAAYDQSYFVQLDGNFDVYLYGQTAGAYPVTGGVYSNANSGQFIHKLNPALSATIYSTVFGSGALTPNISPSAFLVDTCENVYTAGWGGQCIPYGNTGTTFGMPTTANAFQSTTDGCDFYFFVLKKNALSLWYASYFGGNAGSDEHVDGGTSRFDKRGVIYQSVCAGCGGSQNFPTTAGAWSTTNNSFNCNNAVIKMDFQLVNLSAVASAAPSDTICVGSTMNFVNTSIGAHNYIWDFGDASPVDTNMTPSHIYGTIGSYTVTLVAIDSLSCSFSDTTQLFIVVVAPPIVNLGNDTTVCGNLNLPLNAGNPTCTFLWSTGATTQTIFATNPGTYWVNVDNGHCTASDTIVISTLSIPNLGNDTTLCQGNTVTLDAGPSNGTYLWNTGATTQTISVTTSGNYYATVSFGACSFTDSVQVNFVPLPIVNLGNDTTLCPSQTVTLDAGNPGDNYLWSTGATTQTIVASGNGNISVTVSNGSCARTDSIYIHTIADENLGGDQNLCDNLFITLDAGYLDNATYQWSTGENTQTINVSNPGTYWVNVSFGFCTLSDSINVTGGFGSSILYIPNCFTPNGDGKNEVFMPKGDGITSYDMKIFNRWGQLIFETTDINQGWDGRYKGNKVQIDVYVCVVDYTTECTGTNPVHKITHVTVDR
jgi:gliding motility-associated-like protein